MLSIMKEFVLLGIELLPKRVKIVIVIALLSIIVGFSIGVGYIINNNRNNQIQQFMDTTSRQMRNLQQSVDGMKSTINAISNGQTSLCVKLDKFSFNFVRVQKQIVINNYRTFERGFSLTKNEAARLHPLYNDITTERYNNFMSYFPEFIRNDTAMLNQILIP